MNKSELIASITDKTGLSKKDAGASLEATLSTITDALASGDSVAFIGFGTFSTAESAARQGLNPSTGEVLQIAASTRIKFKAGSKLKVAVKAGK